MISMYEEKKIWNILLITEIKERSENEEKFSIFLFKLLLVTFTNVKLSNP